MVAANANLRSENTYRGESRGLPSRTRDALRESGTLALLETARTANGSQLDQRIVLAGRLARF
jgi:hypothetical protein